MPNWRKQDSLNKTVFDPRLLNCSPQLFFIGRITRGDKYRQQGTFPVMGLSINQLVNRSINLHQTEHLKERGQLNLLDLPGPSQHAEQHGADNCPSNN